MPASPINAPTRTVLIVDDDDAVRSALRRVLDGEGYVVHLASGGADGLLLLRERPIQLVISDKDMPRMTGIEFLDLVRDRHPRVCRVMLTGRPDMKSTVEAINRGEVYRFIEKPWSNEHLLSMLHFAFEALELEQENRRLHDELRRQVIVLTTLRETELRQARELERERERSEHLLLNVLPRQIAERLKLGEVAIADRFPEATVLFSDLVSFTELSARMAAADVVSLLNEIFSAFDQLAGTHGVEKIKTDQDHW